MIEDILVQMAAEGFVVSNTFQVGEGDPNAFGRFPSWAVYWRNVRNTRTGHATAETLEGALRAAVAKANEGPTYQRPQRSGGSVGSEAPKAVTSRRVMFAPSPQQVTLGETATEEGEELF